MNFFDDTQPINMAEIVEGDYKPWPEPKDFFVPAVLSSDFPAEQQRHARLVLERTERIDAEMRVAELEEAIRQHEAGIQPRHLRKVDRALHALIEGVKPDPRLAEAAERTRLLAEATARKMAAVDRG